MLVRRPLRHSSSRVGRLLRITQRLFCSVERPLSDVVAILAFLKLIAVPLCSDNVRYGRRVSLDSPALAPRGASGIVDGC